MAEPVKISKASADYRQTESKTVNCRTCAHMLADDRCAIVRGLVKPTWVCDRFAKK